MPAGFGLIYRVVLERLYNKNTHHIPHDEYYLRVRTHISLILELKGN